MNDLAGCTEQEQPEKSPVLVLAFSSYQLMCAIEYLLQNELMPSSEFITTVPPGSFAYKQMIELLACFTDKTIRTIPIMYKGTLEERIGSYGVFFHTQLFGKSFHTLVLGDIRYQWVQDIACSLLVKNIVMVDDGGAVLAVMNYILKPQGCQLPFLSLKHTECARYQLAQQIKASYKMISKRRSLEIFSVFSKEALPAIQANHFTKISQLFNPTSKFTLTNEVHVIGAPFVEKKLITLPDYMNYIRKLDDMFPVQSQKIYVAHRFEDSAEKRRQIEELGYQFRTSEINYEVELLMSAKLPKIVGSILSTSLFNLRAIFGDKIDCRFVRFSESQISCFVDKSMMVDNFTVAQHWQQIFDRLPVYGISEVL